MSNAYDFLIGKIEGAPLYEPHEFAVMQSWSFSMVQVAMKFAEAYHAHECRTLQLGAADDHTI